MPPRRPPDLVCAHEHPECSPSYHLTFSAPKAPSLRVVERLPSPCAKHLLTVHIEHSGIDDRFRPRDRLPIQHSSSHSVRHRHENGLRVPAPQVRREEYYHNFESIQILANRSQQETSPDTSVEVNPVPPLGWRRMADPHGNKGQAPLETSKREDPSHSCTFPVNAMQRGAPNKHSMEAGLPHRNFNQAPQQLDGAKSDVTLLTPKEPSISSYDTQGYIDHLDSLRNDMKADQRRIQEAKLRTASQYSTVPTILMGTKDRLHWKLINAKTLRTRVPSQ